LRSKRLIDTRIEIAAPAMRVWDVLTDFARFPQWNPFIVGIDRIPEPGARLRGDERRPQTPRGRLAHRKL